MCSGSRGVFVIKTSEAFTKDKFEQSIYSSRNGAILIEDYIDFSNKIALEREVFLINGKIVVTCLYRVVRDKKYNTVPQYYCSNIGIDENAVNKINDTLQKIFAEAGINWGEYNVELVCDKDKNIFVIEINARQGGMMLPDFVDRYTKINLSKLLVSTSVNDNSYIKQIELNNNWNENCIHFRLFAEKTGIFEGIDMDESICKYLVKKI